MLCYGVDTWVYMAMSPLDKPNKGVDRKDNGRLVVSAFDFKNISTQLTQGIVLELETS